MWDHIINIHPNELLSTKTKESRINELLKKKEKEKEKRRCFTIIFFIKKMDIWYLIISIQFFFKDLTKYKNDYH